MKKYYATVNIEKRVQNDNWHTGAGIESWITHTENLAVEFTDTKNLIEKLAEWASSNFDIDMKEFIKFTHNECDPNRFDFCQTENGNSDKKVLTESDPDGYLCDYSFYVSDVRQSVEYIFKTIPQ